MCLSVWGFSSHSRIFHSYGDVYITCEGLQILTCARHSWPLSSEGSFSVRHPLWPEASVYNGHLRGPVTLMHTYCRAFGSGAVTTSFYDLGLSRLGFEYPIFRFRGERSSPLRHRRGRFIWIKVGRNRVFVILDEHCFTSLFEQSLYEI